MASTETSVKDRAKTGSFLPDWSIEIVPTESVLIDPAIRSVREGSRIYVASIPGRDTAYVVAAAAHLRKARFEPIPHISARGLRDHHQLDDLLARLRGEADVQSVLLLGGDIDDPRVGAFASSRAILETGLFARHGFRAVGFATYAEPHPQIPQCVLENELMSKLEIAAQQGFSSWLVTQLCFNPEMIIRHAEFLRGRGVRAPIHVGIAGPTSWKGMARFAMICGVSTSARSLTTQGSRIGRLLLGYEPSEILHRVSLVAADRSDLGLVKPHFFTFGGIAKTVSWANSFYRTT
jgi:methylenetetrahydrofolate reductase (NADPH)